MATETEKRIILHRWFPMSLEILALDKVIEMLLRLNDNKIDAEFPWLTPERNPFLGIPHELIEHIVEMLRESLFFSTGTVQKELLKILLCKKLKKIDLSLFYIEEGDVLDVLKLTAASESHPTFLGVNTNDADNKANPWLNIPEALDYLKVYVKTLPSLTHLNVSGVGDDELLEIVGACCPNLVVLVAQSEHITSEGLKRLCVDTNDPDDEPKRCRMLQKISLDPTRGEEYLLEGIEMLLLHLPRLRVLWCSPVTLGKVMEKVHREAQDCVKFQLREYRFDGSFPYASLPTVITERCPFLTTLKIWNASNAELLRFEYIPSLRDILIGTTDNLLNFRHGIAPFLQKMGKRLEVLRLMDVDAIDYDEIDSHCPRLNKLECHSMGALTGRISGTPVFRNIQELYMDSSLSTGLQPIDCIRLLSNCLYLRSVILCCCEDFSRGHLKEVLLRNPLRKLRRIHITSSTLSIEGKLSDIKSICN